jgi:hypothetical protein
MLALSRKQAFGPARSARAFPAPVRPYVASTVLSGATLQQRRAGECSIVIQNAFAIAAGARGSHAGLPRRGCGRPVRPRRRHEGDHDAPRQPCEAPGSPRGPAEGAHPRPGHRGHQERGDPDHKGEAAPIGPKPVPTGVQKQYNIVGGSGGGDGRLYQQPLPRALLPLLPPSPPCLSASQAAVQAAVPSGAAGSRE